MKIIYVDREIKNSNNHKLHADLIYTELKARRHEVDVGMTIPNTINREICLSCYDLAIVHPSSSDCRLLISEMEKRTDFKVILQSEEPEGYLDLLYTRGQCYSIVYTSPESLLNLVDKIESEL